MRKEDFNNALNHIDYSLVEEHIREKELLEARANRRRSISHTVRIAACFLFLALISPIILILTESPASMPQSTTTTTVLVPPEVQGPVGDDDTSGAIILRYDYWFVFWFESNNYYCLFSATNDEEFENEMYNVTKVPERFIGELLGTVEVSDQAGNKTVCNIYAYVPDPTHRSVVIELREGVFHPAERYAN